MPNRESDAPCTSRQVTGRFRGDVRARREISLSLAEFLVYALEQRVTEANEGRTHGDVATLNDYIESELVNLITVRDVAELEGRAPGFGAAVTNWLDSLSAVEAERPRKR